MKRHDESKEKAALSGAVLLLSLSMATSVFAETGTVTANVKLRSAASTNLNWLAVLTAEQR